MMNSQSNRRTFLKSTAVILGSLALPLRFPFEYLKASAALLLKDSSPFTTLTSQELSSTDFSGDEFERAHKILWDKLGFIRAKGGIPAPSDEYDVVVVGGGISGLIAAYELRDKKVLLLEGASRFGGNSRGERIGNTDFSIGAAYITKPDEGDENDVLLKELGLQGRLEGGEESVVNFKGKMVSGFWQGATDPERAEEFKKVYEKIVWIGENAFPDIPWSEESQISKDEFLALDDKTAEEWLTETFGELHPHIHELMELYTWSSFGGSLSEISAAQFLNFFSCDILGTIAFPGGNAAIAEAIVNKLSQLKNGSRIEAGAYVADVKADDSGVTIAFENAHGEFLAVRAKSAVVAVPKFVAGIMVSDMDQDQIRAIRSITYRSYIVANVLLEGGIKSPSYELFRLEGKVPSTPSTRTPEPRPYSDLCFGSWAAQDKSDFSVLTIYRAYSAGDFRQYLWRPAAFSSQKASFEKEIPNLLSTIGVDTAKVKGLRLSRWGHAMPIPEVGMIKSGTTERISKPVKGRIFFANQDNWLNACFETAGTAAREAAKSARELL